jgi:tetratricopeptide (TPR) repeat protein
MEREFVLPDVTLTEFNFRHIPSTLIYPLAIKPWRSLYLLLRTIIVLGVFLNTLYPEYYYRFPYYISGLFVWLLFDGLYSTYGVLVRLITATAPGTYFREQYGKFGSYVRYFFSINIIDILLECPPYILLAVCVGLFEYYTECIMLLNGFSCMNFVSLLFIASRCGFLENFGLYLPQALGFRADTFTREKQYRYALEFYDRSMVLLPRVSILICKAKCYYELGQYTEAIALLEKHHFWYRYDGEYTYMMMAQCYRQLSEFDKAQEYIEKVLEINPNNEFALQYTIPDAQLSDSIPSKFADLFVIEDSSLIVANQRHNYWMDIVYGNQEILQNGHLQVDMVHSEKLGCQVFERQKIAHADHHERLDDSMTPIENLYAKASSAFRAGNYSLASEYAREAYDMDNSHQFSFFLQRTLNPLIEIPVSRFKNTGGFGKVTKIWPNLIVKVSHGDKKVTNLFLEEVNNLRYCACANVISYKAHYVTKERKDYLWHFILMDKVDYTLADMITKKVDNVPPFTFSMIYPLIVGLLKGLIMIHSRGIVHCDIKPQNIGIKEKMNVRGVKILDFGGSLVNGKSLGIHTDKLAIPSSQEFLSQFKYIWNNENDGTQVEMIEMIAIDDNSMFTAGGDSTELLVLSIGE